MFCPKCKNKVVNAVTKVYDSRRRWNYVHRRRLCPLCKFRFTTVEVTEDYWYRKLRKDELRTLPQK